MIELQKLKKIPTLIYFVRNTQLTNKFNKQTQTRRQYIMAKDENSVYIGKRPTMNYVMAAMMILNKDEPVTVKARGRAISHAVDVCEILKNRFLKGTTYEDIRISTEKLESDDGTTNNVSSIEIVLAPPE